MGGGQPAFDAFLAEVPTMEVRYELGRLREQSDNRRWTANDLRDIEALSGALVYADVVVTENSWTSMAQRAEIPERFGTIVLSDLAQLIDVIIAASVTTGGVAS